MNRRPIRTAVFLVATVVALIASCGRTLTGPRKCIRFVATDTVWAYYGTDSIAVMVGRCGEWE